MQWQGPYKVTKQVGKVNYLIDMHDRRQRKRLFHINMLREYLPSTAVSTSYWSESRTDVDEDDEIPVWKEESAGVVHYGPQLTEQQRTDLDSLMRELGTARFISTLDLTLEYWQVPVAKEARYKTAFVTPFGLYHFDVMPSGLQGAPATFQRLMDGVIQGLEGRCAAY